MKKIILLIALAASGCDDAETVKARRVQEHEYRMACLAQGGMLLDTRGRVETCARPPVEVRR